MNQADKTKTKFANALKELCQSRALDKISVTELINVCNVNRSTFYYHFIDIDDLIQWIFHADIIGQCFKIAPVGWDSNVFLLFDRIRQDRIFYKQALLLSGERRLEKEMCHAFYGLIVDYIHSLPVAQPLNDSSVDFIAKFYAYATASISIEYIQTDSVETPREMTDKFFDVFYPGIIQAIENMVNRKVM